MIPNPEITPTEWSVQDSSYGFGQLPDNNRRHYKIAASFALILSFFYISALFDGEHYWFFPIFIGWIGIAEFLGHRLHRPLSQMAQQGGASLEAKIFALLTAAQALSLSIWGFQSYSYYYEMPFLQFFFIHLTFLLYLASRTGLLVQGRLGMMVWSDLAYSSLLVPVQKLTLLVESLLYKMKSTTSEAEEEKPHRQTGLILLSLLISLGLIIFVIHQLSQVSEAFATTTQSISTFLEKLFYSISSKLNIFTLWIKFVFAVPVALWGFAMVGGSFLQAPTKRFSFDTLQEKLTHLRVFPSISIYMIVTSLCLVYGLFFITSLTQLGELLSQPQAGVLTPAEASTLAVTGFWQLVRVSALNISILAGWYLVGKESFFTQKTIRTAFTVLFAFATLFALLAAWKLFGIYIFLYGPTLLRLLSGWLVSVLLVWCVLILVRFYTSIHAIRIGLFYAFISFTVLTYLIPLLLG